MSRRLAWLALACACASRQTCTLALEPGPDAREPGPDARTDPDAACLDDSERTVPCEVRLTGQVVDFVTLEPYLGGATVSQSTAWDGNVAFPVDCPPLAMFTLDPEGGFDYSASCRSDRSPPILLVTVAGGDPAPRARTAWDRTVSCVYDACDAVFADLWTPSEALVAAWRAQLVAGGMVGADVAGLAVVRYNDRDGQPAPNVVPTNYVGAPLRPGSEVRFLAADRATLLPADTRVTGETGVALVSTPIPFDAIAGIRNRDYWPPSGLLFADGWLFLEDLDVAPE